MNEKKSRRLPLLLSFFAALLLLFVWQLVDLQVVHGASYRAQSVRKIATTETVEAARGEILDRNGLPIVTNRVSWQLTLDLNQMGEARIDTLVMLDALVRREGYAFTDSLPLSRETPFVLTIETLSESAQGRFTRYLESLKRSSPTSAEELLQALSEQYQLPDTLTPSAQRSLCGLLYELDLRKREISTLPYVPLEKAEPALLLKIKEQGLRGVNLSPRAERQYLSPVAAHSLGRVGRMSEDEWTQYRDLGYSMDAVVGKDGVEGAFEAALHGTPGLRSREYDTEGRVLAEVYQREPIPGQQVRLTLDLPLQETVERVLQERVPTLGKAEGAAVAMLDVRDGGVLALASYPTFPLERFSADYGTLQEDPLRPLLNRPLQGLYAPGSTFKMVTAVAGLEEGLITPQTKILDTGRYTYYRNPQPRCWLYRQTGRTHGTETVSEAITDSCNIFFYDLGRRLGSERLEQYARLFGLGEATGIELRGEETGVVAGKAYTESRGETWYEGNTLSAAIGQENNRFTPLQLASYTATLANGGTRHQVHLLHELRSNNGKEVVEDVTPTVLDRISLSADKLEAVKSGMLAVTEDGSVSAAFRRLPVKVAAKTGSAQVTGSDEANAVFVCFAPYENPEVALAIVVEKGASGSDLGRMAAEILEAYFAPEA